MKTHTVVGRASSADPSRILLSSETASSTINQFGLYKLLKRLGEWTIFAYIFVLAAKWQLKYHLDWAEFQAEAWIAGQQDMRSRYNVAYRFQIPALWASKPATAGILHGKIPV